MSCLAVIILSELPEGYMSLSELKDLATIAGVGIATLSLVFVAFNTWFTLRINRARFWLDLRDRFGKYETVHRRLRPGGEWAGRSGPSTPEEWAEVEAYMGQFEHCEIMFRQRLIDERTFREIYRYRLENILANDVIRREKLIQRAKGWTRFLALLKRMELEVKQ